MRKLWYHAALDFPRNKLGFSPVWFSWQPAGSVGCWRERSEGNKWLHARLKQCIRLAGRRVKSWSLMWWEGRESGVNLASACAVCSHPWIFSPLSLWQLRRLEVWPRLCVNMPCQLWELRASGQLRYHTLLLSPWPLFFTLDLDQRLRLDPSHGSSEFYTRVRDGVIRPEGAPTLSSHHRSAKRKHKPYQNILIYTHGCLLIRSCQILFYDCGLFHFAQRAAFVRLASALSLTLAQGGCRLASDWVVPTRARL